MQTVSDLCQVKIYQHFGFRKSSQSSMVQLLLWQSTTIVKTNCDDGSHCLTAPCGDDLDLAFGLLIIIIEGWRLKYSRESTPFINLFQDETNIGLIEGCIVWFLVYQTFLKNSAENPWGPIVLLELKALTVTWSLKSFLNHPRWPANRD